MSIKKNKEDLNLESLAGRLAYAIKSKGPTYVANHSTLGLAQVSRLGRQLGGTTLEAAAEIATATGFELKWIALGQGPMMVNDDLWEYTNTFKEITPLDKSQKINLSFEPDFLEKDLSIKVEDSRIWQVDYKANLKGLERGHTVLIDTRNQKQNGLLLVETNNQKRIMDVLINLDGSVIITMDNDITQNLTADQFKELKIIGEVVWQGGQS